MAYTVMFLLILLVDFCYLVWSCSFCKTCKFVEE